MLRLRVLGLVRLAVVAADDALEVRVDVGHARGLADVHL